MKLARAVHLDDSDRRVFHSAARTGEWCIPGGFEFSDWTEADLVGRARQAFAHGWLGVETFGRASVVAVARAEADEADTLAELLLRHFVETYGAPDADAARPVAKQQIDDMADLCEDFAVNTLLSVSRELTPAGVRETFRATAPGDAGLEQFAIHPDRET